MEKLNIAEILKDCPKGMELDSPLFDDVHFDFIDDVCDIINCYIQDSTKKTGISFSKYGCYSSISKSKCVIFPKGKTTWDGFVPPCRFEDGDVVFYSNTIAIFKEWGDETLFRTHCVFYPTVSNPVHQFEISRPLFGKGIRREARFATEEEKQKLFEAIEANGYQWDTETKTLEKFEYIEDKGNISDGYHTFNELYEYRLLYNASMFNELAKQGLCDVHKSRRHSDGTIPFGDENWFIVQAELPTGQISNHYEMKDWELFNVPEKEKANPYDGHTPQDVAKRLREFLTPKPKYPETYEECCGVLKIPNDERYIDVDVPLNYNQLLTIFTKLLICRDAYWKMAGDWKSSDCQICYGISKSCDKIEKFDDLFGGVMILEFPTKEMRDAFLENFKDLIEQCKELL